MLYEKKRMFAQGVIDLTSLVVDTPAYAGLAFGTDETAASAIDYEAENQQFPDANTLEVFGSTTADSSSDTATLTLTLQSSEDKETWKDEVSFTLSQSEITEGALLRRFTVPAQAHRYLRVKLVAGTEAFTAGKIFALMRPL
jgi:hypothetical protein